MVPPRVDGYVESFCLQRGGESAKQAQSRIKVRCTRFRGRVRASHRRSRLTDDGIVVIDRELEPGGKSSREPCRALERGLCAGGRIDHDQKLRRLLHACPSAAWRTMCDCHSAAARATVPLAATASSETTYGARTARHR